MESALKRFDTLCEAIFFLSLAVLVIFLLSLPVFPSGDGPLHAYYAHIFGQLTQGPTTYSAYYAVRHLVQPYCLHYYAIIFFNHWVSLARAEEIFVVIVLVNTALGFRFMARSLGRHGALASLFIIPLLLSWTLGAGFLNFNLGLGLMFWAVGVWHGIGGRSTAKSLGWFVLLLFLLVLAHPVPLMMLIYMTGCDLLLRLWQEHARGEGFGLLRHRVSMAVLGLTCAAFLVPVSIAEKSKITSVWRDAFPHRSVFLHFIEVKSLLYFWQPSAFVLVYLAAVFLMFPATVFFFWRGTRARLHSRIMTAADRQMLAMAVFLVLTITMPRTVGGAANFSERMWDLGWPVVLSAGAALAWTPAAAKRVFAMAVLLILWTGAIAVPRLEKLSQLQDQLAHVALPAEQPGLLLEPFSTTSGAPGSSYPVFWWSGVRAFTASHAILLNSPWLNQVQIPVRMNPGAVMPGSYMQDFPVEQPASLTQHIAQRQPDALRALRQARFLFYSAPNEQGSDLEAQLMMVLGADASDWSCHAAEIDVVCLRRNL